MTTLEGRALARLRIPVLAGAALALATGGAAPSGAQSPEAGGSRAMGFEAVITGAYEGKVSGAGVLKFLPKAVYGKRSYYFLADGQGVRPHGVTFVLPLGTGRGEHVLKNPSPFDIGTVPSVRVDRDMGSATVSADRNTSGTLELTAFPDDAGKLRGSEVAGRFEFETENGKGERITVKGEFSFKLK